MRGTLPLTHTTVTSLRTHQLPSLERLAKALLGKCHQGFHSRETGHPVQSISDRQRYPMLLRAIHTYPTLILIGKKKNQSLLECYLKWVLSLLFLLFCSFMFLPPSLSIADVMCLSVADSMWHRCPIHCSEKEMVSLATIATQKLEEFSLLLMWCLRALKNPNSRKQ